MRSRREFLIHSGLGALAVAAFAGSRATGSDRHGKHPGIQLYTINEAMRSDPAGTLKKVRQIGFQEVESAGFGKLSAKQFRGLLDDAGLVCPSAHLQFDVANLGASFDAANELGAKFAVCSMMRSLALGP